MLTYIEPCGWCSSSISSRNCPSHVDKSSEPCPNLSSSFSSTSSSISTNDSISLSTDSISYEKRRRQTSVSLIRSSLNHPNDYHTTKRIDTLHERMDDIQITSFLKFINYHLSLKKDPENLHINDLIKDLSNGHILIDLIEILSLTKLKREHGHTYFHSLTNVKYVLDYLKSRMQHIDISPNEIVSGNRKQILALLWIIMKIFDFPAFRLRNKNCFVENTLLGFGQDRSISLKWLNHLLNQSLSTQKNYIKDFYIQTWLNNSYLLMILKYLIPLSLKYLTIKCFDYLKEFDSLNNYDKQYLQMCSNLSNYSFETITIIDYTDKSERSLFKYFTELQEKISIILKTNNISKLIQTNPYTKQILDTIIQTTENSSNTINNNNEQYLVCIEDETINERVVEKPRSLNGEEEEKNQCEKSKIVQSNSHIINDHNEIFKEEQIEIKTNKLQKFNETNDQIKSDESIVITQDFEQPIVEDEKERLIESNEQIINSNKEIEQPIELVILNEKLEQTTTSYEAIEQLVKNEKLQNNTTTEEPIQSVTEEPEQQVIASNEDVEKSEQTVSPPVEEIEQTTVAIEKVEVPASTISESGSSFNIDDKLEESLVKTEDALQSVTSTIEQPTNEKDLQAVTTNQEDILIPTENHHDVVINEILEQPTIIETSQIILSNAIEIENNKNSIPADILEKIEQSTVAEIPPHKVPNQETEQNVMKVVQSENSITSNDKLQQPTNKLEEIKQFIIKNERLDQPSVPVEKVEEIIENKSSSVASNQQTEKPPVTKNKKLKQSTRKESPSSVVSKEKTEQIPVAIVHNKPVLVNEHLQQSVIKESQPSAVSNERIAKPSVTKINNNSVMTNKHLQQSVIKESPSSVVSKERTEQIPVTIVNTKPIMANENLQQSTIKESPSSVVSKERIAKPTVTKVNNNPVLANEHLQQSVIKETPPSVVSNGRTEKPSITKINNNPVMTDEHLKQSVTKELPQTIISSEQITNTPVEKNSSIITNKKLEKPAVIQTQQPIASNGQMSKSNNSNKKSTTTTKKPTSTVSSIQENQHSLISREQPIQSTIVVKEPEQRKNAAESLVQTTATPPRCSRYSDVVNKQLPKPNIESIQGGAAASFKKQEQSMVPKKKATSPVIQIEKPNQSRTTAEQIKQVPLTSTIKESQQPTIVVEEPAVSTISNEETKKSSTKNKKSRRSHAKKGKGKNSEPSVIIDEQQQEEEEEVESTLPSLNLTTIHQEPNPSLEVLNSSTIPKTSSNTSASRSRKNKKKKTTTTATTTLIEKSSSSIIPITTPNRNIFNAIKECMRDRTSIAFKYVFIFICLCFAIVIVVLSHK